VAGLTEAATQRPAEPGLFTPRTLVAIVVAGVVGFVTFLVLVAYAGQLRGSGGDGRPNALSNSAIGFSGLHRLIEFGGGRHRLVRDPNELGTEDLLVVMVESRTGLDALNRLLEARVTKPTLVVLPKWQVVANPQRRGWVQALGPGAAGTVEPLLSEALEVQVAQHEPGARRLSGSEELDGFASAAPQIAQTVAGEDVTALVTAGDGRALVARVGEMPLYVAADPDLLNNHGIADPATARAALFLLDALNATGSKSVAFDLTLNGYGQQRHALRLAFDPPFLALTLALFAAALLAGLHGAARFGAPAGDERALAFGKSALVENSASLFKLARREHKAGGAYAELIREAAAHDSGVHLALRDSELDSYLDRVSPADGPTFSELAKRARAASGPADLWAAARALFQWKKDLIK
jgi:hypothetical protein